MCVSAGCHMEMSNGQAFGGSNENELKVKRGASWVLALKKPLEFSKNKKCVSIYFML